MRVSLLAVGIPVCAIFVISITAFARERTAGRLVQLLGAVCLLMVVLAHIAEAFHLFPWMNWGYNDSPGHYLDLLSAVLGLVLLPVGYLFHWLSARNRQEHVNDN